jgi:hypothetical protein
MNTGVMMVGSWISFLNYARHPQGRQSRFLTFFLPNRWAVKYTNKMIKQQDVRGKSNMKKRLVSLLSVAVLLFTGCSLSPKTSRDAISTGIKITQMDTAMSGSDTEQVVSYHLTLYNGESVNVVVHWIEPVLIEQVSERLRTPDHRLFVEKTLAPNSSLEISGEFTFENKGATKSEIMSWKPLFTGIALSSEMTLPVPAQEGK